MSELVRFDRPPEPPAEQPDWAAKLRLSDRSEQLVRSIIAAVTMLQTRAARLESAVSVPADGSPMAIAEQVTAQTRTVLDAFEADAAVIAEKRLPRVVDLYGEYVTTKTGAAAVDTDAAAEQLIASVKDALGDTIAEVRRAVEDAVTAWFHNGGSVEDLRRIVREQLADAEWQAARVMRTEIQEAYKDLTRRGLREGKATRVYRQAQAAACDFCVAKEGEYDIDDPDAYDTHPNCQCVWYALDAEGREVGDAEVAEMSTLSKTERDKLAVADFGDPAGRLFPIVDQDDVDSAAHLIGKAKAPEAVKRRIVAIARRKGLQLPDAWQAASHSAAFSLGAAAAFSADLVRRTGKIWEAGDYPDKNYSMTPEEMLAAVAEFSPQPGDLEHTETVLSGKLGRLVEVALGENPYDLMGTVEMPKWLSDALPEQLPVSVSWNRQTKRIEGIAYVVDPRVADAAIAAFTKHTPTQPGAAAQGGSSIMAKFSELVRFWERKGRPEDLNLSEFSETPDPAAEPQAAQAATAQPDPKVTALEAEVAQLKAARITADAAAFAAAEIAAHRALPAEQDAMVAAFTQAAVDDASHGVVTFSAGVTKTRVQLLREDHAARPAHVLTQEMLPAGMKAEEAAALFNRQTTGSDATKVSAERRQELLGMTELGRAAMNGATRN